MSGYLIGLDLGTSALKGVLASAEAGVVAVAEHGYKPRSCGKTRAPGVRGRGVVRLSRDSWVVEVLNPELGGSP